MSRRRRTEQGVVLPTRLMVFSISAVALAGLVFVATQGDDSPDTAAPSSSSPTIGPRSENTTLPPVTVSKTPTVVSTPTTPTTPTTSPTTPLSTPPKPVDRARTAVVVFNNSNIKGLAGKTATKVSALGWNVVATDNWYGKVDGTTVYYGPKMKDAAQLLAKDLGITLVKPAVAPMHFDRLTVILTATYQ